MLVFFHTSTWISHRYTYVPFLLNLPLYPTPLHCHRAPDLNHTANSHWLFYMVMYMFQWYSPNLLHPLLPPLCLQVCSLYLCIQYCLANRFMKGCCWTIRHRDSWPPQETNPIRGQRWGWTTQRFSAISFIKVSRRQRKLLTQASEGGRKSTPLPVFSWMLYSH